MLLLYPGIFGILLEFWLMWICLFLPEVINLEIDHGICSSIMILYEHLPSSCAVCNSVGHDVAHCRLVGKQLNRQNSLKKDKVSNGTNNIAYVTKSADMVTKLAGDPLASVADFTKEVCTNMNLSKNISTSYGGLFGGIEWYAFDICGR